MQTITTKKGFLEIMKYKRVLDHLMATNQGFCFVDGAIVTREDCQLIINQQ